MSLLKEETDKLKCVFVFFIHKNFIRGSEKIFQVQKGSMKISRVQKACMKIFLSAEGFHENFSNAKGFHGQIKLGNTGLKGQENYHFHY
jgi:hypothetical protein